jgi:hypothetical protein
MGDPIAGHAGEILCHGDLLDLVFPGTDLGGDPVSEFTAGLHQSRHIGQFMAGDLKTGEGTAKGLSVPGVFEGFFWPHQKRRYKKEINKDEEYLNNCGNYNGIYSLGIFVCRRC